MILERVIKLGMQKKSLKVIDTLYSPVGDADIFYPPSSVHRKPGMKPPIGSIRVCDILIIS